MLTKKIQSSLIVEFDDSFAVALKNLQFNEEIPTIDTYSLLDFIMFSIVEENSTGQNKIEYDILEDIAEASKERLTQRQIEFISENVGAILMSIYSAFKKINIFENGYEFSLNDFIDEKTVILFEPSFNS